MTREPQELKEKFKSIQEKCCIPETCFDAWFGEDGTNRKTGIGVAGEDVQILTKRDQNGQV